MKALSGLLAWAELVCTAFEVGDVARLDGDGAAVIEAPITVDGRIFVMNILGSDQLCRTIDLFSIFCSLKIRERARPGSSSNLDVARREDRDIYNQNLSVDCIRYASLNVPRHSVRRTESCMEATI